ncbi:MAG: substrate-binding domain-containing protein [Deltaproteobacteria bacterium]|nr:substrate-binding domain-containing protein [Deltaproteobacteria bacterium]
MKKTALFFLSIIILLLMPASGLAKRKLVIAGTGDSQLLLRTLAKAFEKKYKKVKVDVPDSIGSSGGIRAVAEGAADLGRVAREIKEIEKKYKLNYMLFARSPVVFAVNPSVRGVDNVSRSNILKIMKGEISSWTELGGDEYKIYIVQREFGDSSRTAIGNIIPELKEMKEMVGKTFFSTPDTVAALSRYQYTLGYTSLSAIKGTDLIILKVDGIYPSAENIINDSYPYVVPLGFVWQGKLKGLKKKFINFVKSKEGKRIITEFGAVPTEK